MHEYLMHLHTSNWYNRMRFSMSQKLTQWGVLNENRRRSILRFNNSVKSLLANQANISKA